MGIAQKRMSVVYRVAGSKLVRQITLGGREAREDGWRQEKDGRQCNPEWVMGLAVHVVTTKKTIIIILIILLLLKYKFNFASPKSWKHGRPDMIAGRRMDASAGM